MARGVNKVILVGNLGADPETRYMPSGGAERVSRPESQPLPEAAKSAKAANDFSDDDIPF